MRTFLGIAATDFPGEQGIDRILSSRPPGARPTESEFLVRWLNSSPSEDSWLSYDLLKQTAALTTFLSTGGGPSGNSEGGG